MVICIVMLKEDSGVGHGGEVLIRLGRVLGRCKLWGDGVIITKGLTV